MTFGIACDSRKRLTRETRVESPVTIYDLHYYYDQLGNRLSKVDLLGNTQTDYYYDVDISNPAPTMQADSDPRLARSSVPTPLKYTHDGTYGGGEPAMVDSRDNRLIYYSERPVGGGGGSVTREVWYNYYQSGNASNIIVKDAGNSWFRGMALYYGTNEQLWRVLWDQWEGGVRGPFNNYTILGKDGPQATWDTLPHPREFYYNSAGGRILSRPMKIVGDGSAPNPYDWQPVQGLYGFYDEFADNSGLTPTGDFRTAFSFNGNTMFERDQYMPGAGGLRGRQKYGDAGEPEEYWHADLVGSTMRLSDAAGQQSGPTVRYTAFGEVIQPDNSRGGQLPSQYPRYGYVGEYGYESDLLVLAGAAGSKPVVLSHVGARWYDGGSGRFAQRDPLAPFSALNPYEYARNNPLIAVDPDGRLSRGGAAGALAGAGGAAAGLGPFVFTPLGGALVLVAGITGYLIGDSYFDDDPAVASVPCFIYGYGVGRCARMGLPPKPQKPSSDWDWWDDWEDKNRFDPDDFYPPFGN